VKRRWRGGADSYPVTAAKRKTRARVVTIARSPALAGSAFPPTSFMREHGGKMPFGHPAHSGAGPHRRLESPDAEDTARCRSADVAGRPSGLAREGFRGVRVYGDDDRAVNEDGEPHSWPSNAAISPGPPPTPPAAKACSKTGDRFLQDRSPPGTPAIHGSTEEARRGRGAAGWTGA